MADTVATLEAAMASLRGTDTASISKASAYIRAYGNKASAPPAYFHIIGHSPDGMVRQLAAVLLRPKMIAWWNRCAPAERAEMQALLLQRIGSEQHSGARKAIVTCIASLAKALMPGNNWPELTAVMTAILSDPAPQDDAAKDFQLLGFIMCREILDAMGAACSSIVDLLLPWVENGMSSAQPKVQSVALRCASYLLRFSESKHSVGRLSALLGPIVTITQTAMEAANDTIVVESLDTLRALIEADSPVIHSYVEPLAQFFISVMCHASVEDSTKAEASEGLMALIDEKPKTFVKKGLVDAVLPIVVQGLVLYDPEEERESIEEARNAGVEAMELYDASVWNIAGRLLDSMCMSLPTNHMFRKVTDLLVPHLSSPEPAYRHAALMGLGIAAQGCRSAYADNLDSLLQAIIGVGENDTDPVVREGEMYALSQLAEYICPGIISFHDTIIPAVLRMLEVDSSMAVVEHACSVLENFVDGLDPHITALYIEPIMSKLGEILVAPGQSLFVQEIAVAAIASVAASASHHVTPYLSGIHAAVGPMLTHTDARFLRLRSAATEALGYTAIAVGKDAYREFLPGLVASVLEGFQHDHLELQEKSFTFFGCMAECFGDEFADYVPNVAALCEDRIKNSEALHVYDPDADEDEGEALEALGHLENAEDEEEEEEAEEGGHGARQGAGAAADGEDGDEDEDDDESEGVGARARWRVHSSTIEMQVAAVTCLGLMALHCPKPFGAHVMTCFEMFKDMLRHFNPEMVERCITALDNCILCMNVHKPMVSTGEGQPLMLDEDVQPLYNDLITDYILVLRDCPEKKVVATVCVAIQHLCKSLGPAAIIDHHAAIMKQIFKIGRGKSRCQMVFDDGEGGVIADRAHAAEYGEKPESFAQTFAAAAGHGDEEGDDDGDHDFVVDEATDAIVAIAKVMQESFDVYLPNVMKVWRKYTKADRSAMDHLMAIGMYGDLAGVLGDHFVPYIEKVLPVVLAGAACPNKEVQRNCIFAIGSFFHHCTAGCVPYQAAMLERIQAVFAVPRGRADDDYLLDNGVSALCKVLMHLPDALPVNLALPAVLSRMPLRADFDESEHVYTCIMGLLSSHHAAALSHLAEIVAVVGHDVRPGTQCPHHVIAGIIAPNVRNFMATASPEVKASMAAALATLPAEQQEAIHALFIPS